MTIYRTKVRVLIVSGSLYDTSSISCSLFTTCDLVTLILNVAPTTLTFLSWHVLTTYPRTSSMQSLTDLTWSLTSVFVGVGGRMQRVSLRSGHVDLDNRSNRDRVDREPVRFYPRRGRTDHVLIGNLLLLSFSNI